MTNPVFLGEVQVSLRAIFLEELHLRLPHQSCNQLTLRIVGFDFLSSNLWVQTAALHREPLSTYSSHRFHLYLLFVLTNQGDA